MFLINREKTPGVLHHICCYATLKSNNNSEGSQPASVVKLQPKGFNVQSRYVTAPLVVKVAVWQAPRDSRTERWTSTKFSLLTIFFRNDAICIQFKMYQMILRGAPTSKLQSIYVCHDQTAADKWGKKKKGLYNEHKVITLKETVVQKWKELEKNEKKKKALTQHKNRLGDCFALCYTQQLPWDAMKSHTWNKGTVWTQRFLKCIRDASVNFFF